MINLSISYSNKKLALFRGMSLVNRFVNTIEILESMCEPDLPALKKCYFNQL